MDPPFQRVLYGRRTRTNPSDIMLSKNEADLQARQIQRMLDLQNRIQTELGEPRAQSDSSSSDEANDDKSSDSSSSSDDEKKKNKKSSKAKKDKDKKKKSVAKSADTDGAMDLTKFAALLSAMSKPASTSTSTAAPTAPPDPILSDTLSILPPMPSTTASTSASAAEIAQQVVLLLKQDVLARQNQATPAKTGSKVAFKRVDQVYDRKIHNYKLKETVQGDTHHDKWDQV